MVTIVTILQGVFNSNKSTVVVLATLSTINRQCNMVGISTILQPYFGINKGKYIVFYYTLFVQRSAIWSIYRPYCKVVNIITVPVYHMLYLARR